MQVQSFAVHFELLGGNKLRAAIICNKIELKELHLLYCLSKKILFPLSGQISLMQQNIHYIFKNHLWDSRKYLNIKISKIKNRKNQ